MKIAMFLYKSFRHDSRVLREATALGEAGHDVRVIAGHMAAATDQYWGGVRVQTVNKRPRASWLIWGIIERIRARHERVPSGKGRRLGHVLIAFGLRSYGSLAWWRYGARALWVALRDPADVYVAHDLETLPVAALAKALSGGRILYDSHEFYVEMPHVQQSRLARRRWVAIERMLIRRADHVMAASGSLARELQRRYGIALPTVLLNGAT